MIALETLSREAFMESEPREQIIQAFPRRCPYCDEPVSDDQSDLRIGENPVECPSCHRIYIRVVTDLLKKERPSR